MNSIKAFLKAKGLYLVCLALVFAATITGIAAIRSVVRGVEDLTRIQKQASSAQQGTLPHAGWNGKASQAFSGNTLVYNPTLGDWRTHNGTDYTAEQVTAVAAGTVTAIADDALWGRVVEVTDAQDRVWRYCGLEEVAVTQREKVTAGARLGTTGNVPAEAQQGSHLHLECRKTGACLDPEKN